MKILRGIWDSVREYGASDVQKSSHRTSNLTEKIELLVECGMVESLIEILIRQIGGHDMMILRSKMNIRNVFYSIDILSCITPKFTKQVLFLNGGSSESLRERLLEVVKMFFVKKKPGPLFTWFEATTMSRLVYRLSEISSEAPEVRQALMDLIGDMDVVMGMYEIMKSGYDLTYVRFIQWSEKRLNYQVEIIDQLFPAPESRRKPLSIQEKGWMFASAAVQWSASWLLNLGEMYYKNDENFEKFSTVIEQVGFIDDFFGIINLETDNQSIEILLKIMTYVSFSQHGRYSIVPDLTLIEFIGMLSLTLDMNKYGRIMMMNLLSDEDHFSFIQSELGYHLSVSIYIEDELECVESHCGEYVGKALGDYVCEVLLEREHEKTFDHDDEFVVFCGHNSKRKVLLEKAMKENSLESFKNLHLEEARRIFQASEDGLDELLEMDQTEILVIENLGYYFQQNCLSKVEEMKEKKLKSYDDRVSLMARDCDFAVILNFGPMENRRYMSRYELLKLLDYQKTLKNRKVRRKELSIPKSQEQWLAKFEVSDEDVQVNKFKMREIKIYRKYGIPTIPLFFFMEHFFGTLDTYQNYYPSRVKEYHKENVIDDYAGPDKR